MENSRFFSDFYDSVNQRRFQLLQQEYKDIISLYLARLRFDSLLSRTIVFSDAQILDGSFTLSLDPLDLNNSISRTDEKVLPIEVRSRADDLSDSLVAFVKNPNKDKLKGFSFSSIENEEERSDLKERLESTNINEVNKWEDILNIMRSAGVNRENVDKIEQGWSRWIIAQKKGIVIVKKWDKPINMYDTIGSLPERLAPNNRSIVEWVYNNINDRNSIDILLSKKYKDFELENNYSGIEDVNLIKTWLYKLYNYALSKQHYCDSFESILGMSNISNNSMQFDYLDLPKYFWQKLAKMPISEFKLLFYENSRAFNEWWMYHDPEKLRNAMGPLINEIYRSDSKLEITKLEKYLISGISGLATSSLGFISLGWPGLLLGGTVGGIAPLLCEDVILNIHYRPERDISRRIIATARERNRNE